MTMSHTTQSVTGETPVPRARGAPATPAGVRIVVLFYPGVRFAHPRLSSLRPAGAEYITVSVFSLAGPTRPMVQLPWVELFRIGFPAATQNRTERRSRSEAPPQSLAEDHNQRVTRWRCRPREGIGCQAGTGARQSRGNLSDCEFAIHGSSLDRR